MCLGDERELLFLWYNHLVMALEVLTHELSIHQDKLGCIMDEAMKYRL